MSRDIDKITQEVIKNTGEIHSVDKSMSKDIENLQKSVKNIEYKLLRIDETLEKVLEAINNITIFIEDINDEEELEDQEDWTPYDDRNFSYEDDDDDEYMEDSWNNHEDES